MDIKKTLVNKFGIVEVGDRVAYPGRSGSSMWMNFGTVVDIIQGFDWRKNPTTTLKVSREGDSVDYSWRKEPVVTKPRVVTVTRTDNVVKVF